MAFFGLAFGIALVFWKGFRSAGFCIIVAGAALYFTCWLKYALVTFESKYIIYHQYGHFGGVNSLRPFDSTVANKMSGSSALSITSCHSREQHSARFR
jgi:hypothetical protein